MWHDPSFPGEKEAVMSQPIVFISHFKIKDGEFEAFERFVAEGAKALEAEKPGTVVFLPYVNEDRTEVSIVHAFPDQDSMAIHFHGADERGARALEFIEPARFEVYGPAPDVLVDGLRQEAATAGVPLRLLPGSLTGFLRVRPA